MAKILFVIAPENFRDEELFHPKEEVENAGHQAVIASMRAGTCTGSKGGTAEAEISIDEVNPEDFDAIVFVGGQGAAVYFDNGRAQTLAKEFFNSGKVTSAICIAPSTLANAGLLRGKNATCYSSEEENLKSKGANYTAEGVTADGKIITASGPAAAHDFGKKIVEALK